MKIPKQPSRVHQVLLDFERRYWRHVVLVLLGFAFLFTALYTWTTYLISSGRILDLGTIPGLLSVLGLVIMALFAAAIRGIYRNKTK